MIYGSGTDYLQAAQKRVMLFGMSGLGKTRLSNLLRDQTDFSKTCVFFRVSIAVHAFD